MRLAWDPKRVIVQWVGIGTHTVESNSAPLVQMVACLSLVQQVKGSLPGEVENFLMKILYLEPKEWWRCTTSNRKIVPG